MVIILSCDYNETLDGDVDSMWQFDLYDFATFSCSPVQCTHVKIRQGYLWVSDLAALAGGLSHIVFSGLPVIWALVMGMVWCKWCDFNIQPAAGGGAPVPACIGGASRALGSQARQPLSTSAMDVLLWSMALRFLTTALLPCLWHTGLDDTHFLEMHFVCLAHFGAIILQGAVTQYRAGFCHTPIYSS